MGMCVGRRREGLGEMRLVIDESDEGRAERAGVEAAAPPLLVGAAESAVMIWAWRRSVASTSINIVKVARPWLGKRRNQEVGNSTLED